MFGEFKKIWSTYCQSVGRFPIAKVTVRYINQIVLPRTLTNGLGEYVKLLPAIPSGIPTQLDNFFIQIQVPSSDRKIKGMITETILPSNATDKMLKLLLDINVSSEEGISDDDESLWTAFTTMRKFKNDLFLNCITDVTKQSFNKKP